MDSACPAWAHIGTIEECRRAAPAVANGFGDNVWDARIVCAKGSNIADADPDCTVTKHPNNAYNKGCYFWNRETTQDDNSRKTNRVTVFFADEDHDDKTHSKALPICLTERGLAEALERRSERLQQEIEGYNFFTVKEETCSAGKHSPIDSMEMCRAAARAKGVDRFIHKETHSEDLPYGCNIVRQEDSADEPRCMGKTDGGWIPLIGCTSQKTKADCLKGGLSASGASLDSCQWLEYVAFFNHGGRRRLGANGGFVVTIDGDEDYDFTQTAGLQRESGRANFNPETGLRPGLGPIPDLKDRGDGTKSGTGLGRGMCDTFCTLCKREKEEASEEPADPAPDSAEQLCRDSEYSNMNPKKFKKALKKANKKAKKAGKLLKKTRKKIKKLQKKGEDASKLQAKIAQQEKDTKAADELKWFDESC